MKFEEMMMMENVELEWSGMEDEEFEGSSPQIVKGKRTKRRRIGSVSGSSDQDHRSSVTTTEEEEDMANCLIMLAQSGGGSGRSEIKKTNKNNTETTVSSVRSGVNNFSTNCGNAVYECKSCDKVFHSFQALGGHRASHHKKLKLLTEETKTKVNPATTTKTSTVDINRPSPFASSSCALTTRYSKVHECSICGAVFSSGQALGGHMRRHRATLINNTEVNNQMPAVVAAVEVDRHIRNDNINKTSNNFLASLDLNLPAPAEDDQDQVDDEMSHSHLRFMHQQLAAAGTSTTAPPLVGCYF